MEGGKRGGPTDCAFLHLKLCSEWQPVIREGKHNKHFSLFRVQNIPWGFVGINAAKLRVSCEPTYFLRLLSWIFLDDSHGRVNNSSWSPVNFQPNEGIDQPNGQVLGHIDQLHFWEPCCGFPEF